MHHVVAEFEPIKRAAFIKQLEETMMIFQLFPASDIS